jgi:hypothetical protein
MLNEAKSECSEEQNLIPYACCCFPPVFIVLSFTHDAMKNPTQWTKADLHAHLDHALAMELWTIPLYMTALYSIKGLKDLDAKNQPEAAKLIESVVIQEMLHLEIVCNISNALGYRPVFHAPHYEESRGIPFIHPGRHILPEELRGYEVKPGPLDASSIKLFCTIELPHPYAEIEWETRKSYQSIAEMYQALKIGITHWWDECYVGKQRNTRQKKTFKEYQEHSGRHHGFSQVINSAADALKAIDCIIEQGEGADSIHVPADFQPPRQEEGKEFDSGWFKGNLSHYQKFRILLHHHKKIPPVYTLNPGPGSTEVQAILDLAFSHLIKVLEEGFHLEGPEMPANFWGTMFGIKNAIIQVWESGACPQFGS